MVQIARIKRFEVNERKSGNRIHKSTKVLLDLFLRDEKRQVDKI